MSTAQTVTRVVIADDHECFREGLKFTFSLYAKDTIEIVGESKNGHQLLECVRRVQPQVVLTDIRMPEMDGIHACKEIFKDYPSVEIIAMSNFDDPSLVHEMLAAGAKGYLLKTSSPKEMIEAIKTVQNGQNYYCTHTSRNLLRLLSPSKHNGFRLGGNVNLSENEVTVIRLICKQFTTKEIADRMCLSIKSVESYSKQIKEKCNAKNLVGIAMFAIKNGYISTNEL